MEGSLCQISSPILDQDDGECASSATVDEWERLVPCAVVVAVAVVRGGPPGVVCPSVKDTTEDATESRRGDCSSPVASPSASGELPLGEGVVVAGGGEATGGATPGLVLSAAATAAAAARACSTRKAPGTCHSSRPRLSLVTIPPTTSNLGMFWKPAPDGTWARMRSSKARPRNSRDT